MSMRLMGQDGEAGPRGMPASDAVMVTGARRRLVLLAEDNAADVLLVEDAIAHSGLPIDLHVVEDGEKACEFIEKAESEPGGPGPEILMLDLNLPKRSGKEVLIRARKSDKWKSVPVLIVTSSDLVQEREELMALGATRYFRKPSTYDQFMQIGEVLKDLMSSPPV